MLYITRSLCMQRTARGLEMQQQLERALEENKRLLDEDIPYKQRLLKDKEETSKVFRTDGESNDFEAQRRYFVFEKDIWRIKEAIFNVEKGIWLNKEKIMDIRKKINAENMSDIKNDRSNIQESNVQFNPYCV
jgi:hypothetical protein